MIDGCHQSADGTMRQLLPTIQCDHLPILQQCNINKHILLYINILYNIYTRYFYIHNIIYFI